MTQMGFAKQAFFNFYQREPWIKSGLEQSRWPFLEVLFLQKRFSNLDYLLMQRLLRCHPDASQELALFICHLTLAAKEGHLCIRVNEDCLSPTVAKLWQTDEQLPLTLEDELFLTSSIKEGSKQIPIELITQGLDTIATPFTPLCSSIEGDFYLQKHWVYETRFLKHLHALLKADLKFVIDKEKMTIALEKLIANKVLLVEQAEAILNACLSSFSIIMGGPGTGKTYTAGHLIRLFWEQLSQPQRKSCQIVLTAPTGKAAANLQRSLNRGQKLLEDFPQIQAKTLHALLGIKSKGLLRETVRLTADLILVDESSMVDMRLMACLLESLKPGSRLILLGDPFQLPSVEAGSVFADLIRFKESFPHFDIPCTTLKTCLRAELHSLIDFARLINEGQSFDVLRQLNDQTSAGIKRLIFKEGKKESLQALVDYVLPHFLVCLNDRQTPLEILNIFNQVRLLSPMRKGPWGSDALNQLIWEKISQRYLKSGWLAIPIMIITNDYPLDLFNGETGVLMRRLPLQSLNQEDYALFPSRETEDTVRQIPALLLPNYQYAYCLSVHKSQGSEFNRVILLLPEGAELFGREVVYTAVTRAKKQIEILGSDHTIEKTIKQQGIRLSGIETRLKPLE